MTLDQFLDNPPIWLFVVFFAAVWWLVLTILARASGWAALAELYGDQSRLEGPRRRFQSLRMGRAGGMLVNLNGAVTFAATPFSVEISTFFPFSLNMKPLVIPLSDLTATESKMMLVMPAVDFRAARAPEIGIRVSKPLSDWIAQNTRAHLLARAGA